MKVTLDDIFSEILEIIDLDYQMCTSCGLHGPHMGPQNANLICGMVLYFGTPILCLINICLSKKNV